MAGGVDDVDAGIFPLHRGAFGQNGDAALALEIVGIHRALGDLLVFTEGARLGKKLVDEGGLAMIDVGDDRDVADIHKGAFSGDAFCRPGGRVFLMLFLTAKPGFDGEAGRLLTSCCGAHN